MAFDLPSPPPLWTADLPGIGGRIKSEPEDFEVEEIPAYQPCGTGDFLFLWVEKCSMGAEHFTREVARRLGLRPGDVGTAGLKDRHAVTRQLVSVPAQIEARLAALDGDGIRVISVNRHGNKLRPGHLHGNRFRVLIRDVEPDAAARLEPIVERLRQNGVGEFLRITTIRARWRNLEAGLVITPARSTTDRCGWSPAKSTKSFSAQTIVVSRAIGTF